jgi:hypothetical protein
MIRKRLLIVIGTVGLAAAATGCDPSVRKYLGKEGWMFKYLNELSDAVCPLEVNNSGGLDPAKRICPGGPGEKKTTPSYPPPP